MNPAIKVCIIIILLLIGSCFAWTRAQDIISLHDLIKTSKIRLLILPAQLDTSAAVTLDKQVTAAAVEAAGRLGCFRIINQKELENALAEAGILYSGILDDSITVEFGRLVYADDVLIVDVSHFSQVGVSPAPDEKRAEEQERGEPYTNNIHTQLALNLVYYNIETSEIFHTQTIWIEHSGGKKEKSGNQTLTEFKNRLINEFKYLYLLNSEILAIDGATVILSSGDSVGVEKGAVFEIVEPDQIIKNGRKEVVIPGKTVALVCVDSVAAESNRSYVFRQWNYMEPGFLAIQMSKKLMACRLNILPQLGNHAVNSSHFRLGLAVRMYPAHTYDVAFELRAVRAEDSFEDLNLGFGFGGMGCFRFLRTPIFNFDLNLSLDLDILFKKDDEDHTVSAAAFSIPLGVSSSILLTSKSDLNIQLGYRLLGKTGSWQYTEDEESYDAVWYDGEPVINMKGWFLSVGYQYYIF